MQKTVSIIPLIRLPRNMGVFDYAVPEDIRIALGQLVIVPFRNKKILGLVSHTNSQFKGETKEIIGLINESIFLPKDYLTLIHEIAKVYGISTGSAALMFLPPAQIQALTSCIATTPLITQHGNSQIKLLQYYKNQTLDAHLPELIMPHTQTTILVPHAADISRLIKVFPNAITWDASLSQKQKRENWMAVRNGASIIIGTRSAAFVPALNRSNIILIDEESQDHKNWDAQPRYHTLDIIAQIQKIDHSDIIICSKTPRIATLAHVDSKNISQIEKRPATHTTITDIAKERGAKNFNILSSPLSLAIENALDNRRAAFILAHKKGYAHILRCKDCNHIFACNTCKLPQTLKYDGLHCTNCATRTHVPSGCHQCGGSTLAYQSPGIEQVEQECKNTFSKKAKIISFSSGDDPEKLKLTHPSIIIGTKAALPLLPHNMIDVYGIIDIDLLLRMPEYSAAERTLSVTNELMYAADVKQKPPHIVIQTHNTNHEVLSAIAGGQLKQWYAHENEMRKILKFPPHSKLMKISIEHENADKKTNELAKKLQSTNPLVFALHPESRANKKRHALLIKLNQSTWWEDAQKITPHIPPEAIVDIDPISVIN